MRTTTATDDDEPEPTHHPCEQVLLRAVRQSARTPAQRLNRDDIIVGRLSQSAIATLA